MRVIVDDDTTASDLQKPRPGFEEGLRDLERGQLDDGTPVHGIVSPAVDRLTRSVVDWARLLPKKENTRWFVATRSGGLNTRDPMQRILAGMLVLLAEAEAANISARERAKHDQLAEHGKASGGGTRAYGHDAYPVLDANRVMITPGGGYGAIREDERQWIERMVDWTLEGQSLSQVASELNRQGVRTPEYRRNGEFHKGGGVWSAQTVRRILISPRLIGRRMTKEGNVSNATGHIAPLVEDGRWLAVQDIISTHGTKEKGATARKHLLSGFLRCGLLLPKPPPARSRTAKSFAR